MIPLLFRLFWSFAAAVLQNTARQSGQIENRREVAGQTVLFPGDWVENSYCCPLFAAASQLARQGEASGSKASLLAVSEEEVASIMASGAHVCVSPKGGMEQHQTPLT